MVELRGEAKRRYVVDMFTRIARRYDVMNTLMTGGMHHLWRKRAVQVATDGLAGRALDVATGTGDLALALARHPRIDHAVGVDFLPQMLHLGRAKARARGLAGKTTLLLADAQALPFRDATFACVTAGFSLRNMVDPDGVIGALAEMVRVVRPGGRVTTLELTPPPPGVAAAPVRFYFHRLVPLLGQLVTGDRSAYTYLPRSADHFIGADHLAGLFRELGLANVGYQRMGLGTVAVHWGDKPDA